MSSAEEYIRLDFKECHRFLTFPNALLAAIGKLLPEAKFEITADVDGKKEKILKTTAMQLPEQQMVRTVVITQNQLRSEFLQKLLNNNGEIAKNIIVTSFVREKSFGAAQDNNGKSFALEDYVGRSAGNEVDLKGAAKTKFQNPRGNFVERFFTSTFGTVTTFGVIVCGAADLYFSRLNEIQTRQTKSPEPAASVEVTQQSNIKK